MDRAKKRIYTCLFMVVLAAVIIGFIYYWGEMNEINMERDGTLVLIEGNTAWS